MDQIFINDRGSSWSIPGEMIYAISIVRSSNHVYKPVAYHQLSKKMKRISEWAKDKDVEFLVYRKCAYSLEEFSKIKFLGKHWDGVVPDSFSSGIVVKSTEDGYKLGSISSSIQKTSSQMRGIRGKVIDMTKNGLEFSSIDDFLKNEETNREK